MYGSSLSLASFLPWELNHAAIRLTAGKGLWPRIDRRSCRRIPVSEHLFARRTTTTARLTDDAEAMGNDLDLAWIPTEEECPNENASALPENPGIFAISASWSLCGSKSYMGGRREVTIVIINYAFGDH